MLLGRLTALIAILLSHLAFANQELKLPWPSFRHDSKNTGRSTIIPKYQGTVPWSFQTQKGIFSTPVVDGLERVYIGSADKNFYVLDASGKPLWVFKTDEIIDSAALLSVEDKKLMVTIPAGDGFLYHLSADSQIKNPVNRIKWKFDSKTHPSSAKIGYNWFEGNVVKGPDGTIYAGSTNWMYYAIHPLTGNLLWSLEAGNMNWSAGAFSNEGDIYWTSLDSKIRRIKPNGDIEWEKQAWGFVTGSVALDENDNAYIGASDNALYALDQNGETKWYFKSADHIYGSAALGVDKHQRTNAIYFTSADGHLYRLNMKGELVWKFDAGDVIRSSPVVAPKPAGEIGDIIYFGAANGKLFAINSDGTLRWAFNTTPFGNPELEDRNDLNASPALGKNGIYIAGEHGFIWHVPYDYPLSNPKDSRVTLSINESPNVAKMRFATPGGSKLDYDPKEPIAISQVLNCELLVRHNGERIDAGIETGFFPGWRWSDIVHISPETDIQIEKSADGHFLHIRPVDFWQPNTTYTIDFEGYYIWDGFSIGALETSVAAKREYFSDRITFRTMDAQGSIPLRKRNEVTDSFVIRRMAIPYPAMATSLNQIGFDAQEFMAGVVDITNEGSSTGNFLLWIVGAKTDEKSGFRVDKNTDFVFPMVGSFQNDAFVARNTGTNFSISNINIPYDFELRAQLQKDFSSKGASLYGEVSMWSDPVYGPMLALAGLINANGIMPTSGTFLTRALPSRNTANKRPSGLKIRKVNFEKPGFLTSGYVEVTFDNKSYMAQEHVTSLLLIDRENNRPYFLNYKQNLSETVSASGLLTSVELKIPPSTVISDEIDVVIMTDVFPLERLALQ